MRRALLAAFLLGTVSWRAFAGPNGGTVVGGSATIQGQGTSSVTVNQSSQNAIINWQTFNLSAGEITTFNQPNSAAVVLNRVIGGQGPSYLDGTLNANGHVFIVNGDGIIFGPHSSINTAGFLATTSDIRNVDFMAARYNFNIPGLPNASIVNQGSITATSGGFAALVAPGVRNSGTITATLGTVALAAGNAYTLDFYGDNLITLAVNDQIASAVKDVQTGQTLKSLVSNTGTLSANGGRVQLTAAAARAVVDSVINNKGVIEANSIGNHNGMIVLSAATGSRKPHGAPVQTVQVGGTISAAGKTTGTKGGTVVVSGENIQLAAATIDASGNAGGGHVLIGGDTGGGNPSSAAAAIALAKLENFVIPTATTVTVDAASTINVSATGNGNGGKAVLWSNQQTTFAGTILAQGGPLGGDGGFVETSSHATLNFTGAVVNTSAPAGATGNWLLDPADLTIYSVDAATISSGLLSNNVTVTTNADGTTSGPGTTAPELGDINVAANINWTSNNTLTLSAYHDINIGSGVTIANSPVSEAPSPIGSLVLRADNTGTGVGMVNFASGSKIDFSNSNGAVSIFYNPAGNNNATVNSASYKTPGTFSSYVKGGELTAYMLVNTVFDLQNIRNKLSGTYAPGRSIDASVTATWNDGAGFVPIGTSINPFIGVLDGQGYAIGNLTINATTAFAGLFGETAGTVRNVGLNDVNITSAWTGLASGDYAHIGSLAGINAGSISNSYATGTIVSNSSYSIAPDTGGLVGTNSGSITQSYASVNITEKSTGAELYAGGLVGFNFGGTITLSYATGSVTSFALADSGPAVGGLVGQNDGSIQQTYSIGRVTGAAGSALGALVGHNGSDGVVTQSYWDSIVAGSLDGVGVADDGGTFGASGLTTTEFMNSANFNGWNFGSRGGNCSVDGGACWVIVDSDGSLNNASGGAGATRPFLLSDFSGVLNYSVANTSWTYGSVGTLGAVTLTGLPSGVNLSATIEVLSGSTLIPLTANTPAGTYTEIVSALSGPSFTIAASGNINGILTINPAPITVTALGGSSTYGGSPSNPGLTATGLQNGQSVSVLTGLTNSFGITSTTNRGSYTLDVGGTLTNPNYTVTTSNPGAWVVNPATLTYLADPVTSSQGAALPSLTGTVIGFVAGDTLSSATTGSLSFSTTATPNSAIGYYAITGGGLTANNGNYVFVQSVSNATALTMGPGTANTAGYTQVGNNLIAFISLNPSPTGSVVNTQPVNQPPSSPPHTGTNPAPGAGPTPPPGPGGLPPQFGERFFTPPPVGEVNFVQDQAVLQIPSSIPLAQLQTILNSLGLTIVSSQSVGLLGVTSYLVHFGNGQTVASVIRALASYQIIAGAQANYTFVLTQQEPTPASGNDPNLASLSQGEGDAAQYALGKLGLIDIHRQFKGDNVGIAVIDSQIDVRHTDLEGVLADQFDAVGAPDKPHAHGTGMAGAIFAHRRLMGVAPDARLYAVHAFATGATSPESTTFNILKGIEWAASKGVRVINMSFAGPRDPSLERELKAAHDKGIVLIAAAGNAGPKSPPLYPGADPDVIAVTATDADDKIFAGANRGKYIAVAAPGVDILVPAPDNTYQVTTGTSVASAEVSGLAALILERNPELGPEDVRKILTASAHKLGSADDFGSGLVDPSRAIKTAGDFKAPNVTATVPWRSEPSAPAPIPSGATLTRPPVVNVNHPGGAPTRASH